ncbi:hypothetical protein Pcinc_008970 [Petrolisthes cinctipes]|uniref:Protein SMG7 n=1 Tax=Petrolisthes cinctipes TaxID=88211 RepID=A0AAE1G660_PETCI|nr:hypothetical protein Pcinc_008970 [Petrolisthes cinctipes]
MKTASQLLREAEGLKSRLSNCNPLVGNNEAWAVQHQLQVVCGQLLVHWIEAALDRGVERDLWNLGFRNTITQLQAQAKDKQQGGSSEARDLLGWFLNSASGFYLQLFNQICSEYGLDLPFRRKDSIYGAVDLNGSSQTSSKTSSQKNALYLCQYCLVHLGDLARYRHQAKQAETYYRHAVLVAPTSGHPYNQLALLEAGRGNRLAAVALYVRAMCVPCPFPGAPANLTQTLSKLLASSGREDGGSTRVTGEEYTSLFLQCHARLYLHADVHTARQALPTLASALSTLVATNAFTRTNLIQMVVVNLFALSYFSGVVKIKTGEEIGGKKDEEKLEKPKDPKECEGCLQVVEEVTVGMLAALLLPVHTIRDSDQLMTYPGLPAIRLLFEWVRCENSMLMSEAMKKKQQIWPGLCTLVNNLQQHLGSFNADKYSEVPLAEDWDLQGFEPLQKVLNKFKYREGLCKPSPEEYNCIRASRLTDVAKWFTEQVIDGNFVIKIREGTSSVSGGLTFEPMHHSSPPVDEVRALEQLSLHPSVEEKSSSRRGKVGILKPQGSLERARETREQLDPTEHTDMPPKAAEDDVNKEQGGQIIRVVSSQSQGLPSSQTASHQQQTSPGVNQGQGESKSRPPRTRTNVALQAIMKRNSAIQEAKQVTFKTPSPAISPNPSEASSDSHRSQLSTPPLLSGTSQRDPMSSSPMPFHQTYQMAPAQGQGTSFTRQNQGNEANFPNQHFGGQAAWGRVSGNSSAQHNLNMPLQQQNQQPLNTGLTYNAQTINNVGSTQNILEQLQSPAPNQADLLTAGMFNRPPPEGFHQMGSGHLPPPRPGLDISTRMREPTPRMREMMGLTRAPPSFGPVEGLANPIRVRPPGNEGPGLENPRMAQVPYRAPQQTQDINSSPSQTKMNPMFPPGAMSPHHFGLDGRQTIGGSSVPGVPGGLRSMFGDSTVGEPRSPGFTTPMSISWGTGQNEVKTFPVSHPPTLASLLQQHAPVDMRLNLSMDNGSEQHTSGIPRLPGGTQAHNPTISPRSPPGVGQLGVHLGMLPRPSTQPSGPRHLAHPANQHTAFMPEGGENDGPSGNTYSLFSPVSGNTLGMGAGPSRTVPHPLYPATSQPTGQQSLWSGPGPSPLERLLEQKKYSSVPK